MKRLLTAIALSTLLGCASLEPLPGQTAVNGSPRLKRDVLYTLSVYEKAVSPTTHPKVIDTRVIEAPARLAEEMRTGLAVAKWTERWYIDRGDAVVTYKIQFDMQGSKGTDFGLGLENPKNTNGVREIPFKLK